MGIYFGSETTDQLDHYDEGSFTVYQRGAEGGNTNMGSVGHYKKIGKLVFLTVSINNAGNNGIGGQYYIPAPFTPANQVSNQQWHSGDVYWYPQSAWDDYTDFNGYTATVVANTAEIYLVVRRTEQDRQTTLSGGSGARNGNISTASNTYLRFSLNYWTA